jgi:hypothetical protein
VNVPIGLIAYLPMVATILLGAGLSSQLVARIGARPLMVVGPLLATGGMLWLSRISEHSTYAGGLLGPMMATGLGMGLTFVPLSLVALARVPDKDAGVASSLAHGAHLSKAAQTALSNHALAYGFGRGYLVSAVIAFLALVISLAMIRIKRADLEGVDPMAARAH